MEEFATVLVDAIVPQDGEDSTVRSPVGVILFVPHMLHFFI